ncbi:hypothetical protein SLEP1_g10537 [Rubroshorea leprosula]|uniref:Uncharacterized protein n=1 Tax=Rubroshorea leprosula TaxID=152421 RepID=A0AAV5I8D7_9ROSI|nr:hypothetical protein SLEP1_g10537 [Rubroshorea leprosula]
MYAVVQPQPHFSPSLTLGLGRNSHLTSAPHSRSSAATALIFAPHSRSSAATASLQPLIHSRSQSELSPHFSPSLTQQCSHSLTSAPHSLSVSVGTLTSLQPFTHVAVQPQPSLLPLTHAIYYRFAVEAATDLLLELLQICSWSCCQSLPDYFNKRYCAFFSHCSKLNPDTIEALMCLQDWLRTDLKGSLDDICFFTQNEDMDCDEDNNLEGSLSPPFTGTGMGRDFPTPQDPIDIPTWESLLAP